MNNRNNSRCEFRRHPRGARPRLRVPLVIPVQFIECAPISCCIVHRTPGMGAEQLTPDAKTKRQPNTWRELAFHVRRGLLHHRKARWVLAVLMALALAPNAARAQTNAATGGSNDITSFVIEAAGQVEFISAPHTNWQRAAVGDALRPGDRVRTHAQSRAAVQLSDRSVIRLNERTTLEILPPRRAGKKRFGLPGGSLFFFNREKPADVEFDTPLAAGAIRGTEFLLEVVAAGVPPAVEPGVPPGGKTTTTSAANESPNDGPGGKMPPSTAGETPAATSLRLALIDGLVALSTSDGEITLERGQELNLKPGQPPQKTALVNANAAIQWALYYPAVLNPDDLRFTTEEQTAFAPALENYRAGDLLTALAILPDAQANENAAAKSFRAQLDLAVGRVAEAERLLAGLPNDAPAKIALTELIGVVRGSELERRAPPRRVDETDSGRAGARRSASELLAHTYSLQAKADLPGALAAARQASELAPQLGFARARLAELEFSFGNRRAALAELDRALNLSPRLAPAHALRGFVLLEQGDIRAALSAFDHARELDAAFGPAWLGRGLCLLHEREFAQARAAFQAAAALEPQRGLFRAYLGKAASELGDTKAAEKEFNLAKRLDPNDPTAWLYSALHLWQENRLNEAIRDLEKSSDLNDNRAPFRSRLLLDGDRSVRSANLAALYDEAGIPDASRHAAARSVAEDYANFSGHLFLANSYQALADANRFDLRLETAWQSELLVANLLAPPGAGNLSQKLSQQEHLRFFDARPVGVSSFTEYGSGGDWRQVSTVFGTLGGFSYALDSAYESANGQQPNGDSETRQFTLTLKQRVTPDDELYFQAGHYDAEAGDVANYYDPAKAKTGFHVHETQEPTLFAGWHHTWSPGSHTLLLVARLNDRLAFQDPDANFIFLRQIGGVTTEVVTRFSQENAIPIAQDFASDFTLYSAELQQIWENPRQSLVIGGRWQSGDVDTHAALSRIFPITDDHVSTSLQRGNIYAYHTWRIFEPLRLITGVSYDHITFPENSDLPPLTSGSVTRDLLSPKAGLLFTPWERGLLRASYTKSLGGLYFDNSVRLEPTQIGGFNQAFRSLIPESVAGLVPGTEFETAGVGFDQSLPGGTWFGVEAERLTSDGSRMVGTLTNSQPVIFWPPDSPASTRQNLNFRESSLSAYAGQLLGDNFSVGARYRVSEARLNERFPDIPDTATGLNLLEATKRATLQHLSLSANFNHRSGVFAQWESAWYHQDSSGDTPALPGGDFWQHNLMAGYRFPRRHAELRVGVLNLLDTDYRLNPLNLHADMPRGRTFVASLRLNF